MSAFDRLQNYSSRTRSNPASSVFDVKTPEGAFLAGIHRCGLSMYKTFYKMRGMDAGSATMLSEEAYAALTDDEKSQFEQVIEYSELHDVLTTPGNQVVNAVAGSGKALPYSAKVVSPKGYVPIGELKVGDLVAGDDGYFHKVIGVFPQTAKKHAMVVHFSDGNSVVASSDHLWTVQLSNSKFATMKTADMMGKEHLRIPACRPVQFIETPTSDKFDASGFDELAFSIGVGYCTKFEELDLVREVAPNPSLIDDLHSETLDYYRCAVPKVRAQFLAGALNDSIKGENCYIYHGLSEETARTVQYMAESLGLIVRSAVVNEIPVVTIYTDLSLEQIARCELKAPASREIISVEETGIYMDMICIAIDSESQLFLTDHFIPTHNTTALVLKILHDIVTGEAMTFRQIPNGQSVRVVNKVWVCTFLKSGAEELGEALADWQTRLGYTRTASQVSFSTMDAEFNRCLKAMGVNVVIGETYPMFKKAIDMCNITRNNGYALNKEDYQILQGIFVYCRGRLDEKRYQHPSAKEYGLTKSIMDMVLHYFSAQKQAAGVMDFEDVMELLYKYLYVEPNAAVQDFVSNRYNFIYVDEFQDTSQMAYAILKFYARGRLWMNMSGQTEGDPGLFTGRETTGKFVVVGDPSQCLVAGSKVLMADGSTMKIEDIYPGDMVQVALGCGRVGSARVSHYNKMSKSCEIITLVTELGHKISATFDHKIPVAMSFCRIQGTAVVGYQPGATAYVGEDGPRVLPLTSVEELTKGKLDNSTYIGEECLRAMCEVHKHDRVVVRDSTGLHYEYVVEIRSEKKKCDVYDITVDGMHNFFVDGVLVHNCIYSFRGSDSKILTESVDKDFRPVLSCLSVNWRCPENILDPIVPSIHNNSDSASQDIRAAKPGGEFEVYGFSSMQSMLEKLKVDVQKDMEENMSTAVLCRTNFDGLLPAFILEDSGKFNFSISGENMTLDSPLPRKLLGVATLFTEKSSKGVKTTLEMLCGRARWEVAHLMEAMKTSNLSIWSIPQDDLQYSAPSIAGVIADIKKIIFIDGKRDRTKDIVALKYLYVYFTTDVFDGDSAYAESARSYLTVLLYMMASHNFQTVYEFLEEVNFINDKLHARVKKADAPVQIATVHEFKGKERDSIIIWNDSNLVYPSAKCNEEDTEQLAEERRVHYIACTRARKRERIYTRFGQIGRFVNEMKVTPKPVVTGVSLPKK